MADVFFKLPALYQLLCPDEQDEGAVGAAEHGIKSERRLVEEVQLNIAYRWFCGFELDDTIPNHSTFSKTRTRKWQQSSLFQKAFYEIVKQCIDSGLIDGEAMAADGSYIPANVSRESWINVETEVEQSMQSYLDSLDEELSNQPGFKKPPTKIVRKCRTTSQTDPDSGSSLRGKVNTEKINLSHLF